MQAYMCIVSIHSNAMTYVGDLTDLSIHNVAFMLVIFLNIVNVIQDSKPEWLVKDLGGKMPCLDHSGKRIVRVLARSDCGLQR